MIQIPAGEVRLRDDRKKTVWTAEVDTFLLAPVPVTNNLFISILHETPERKDELQVPVVNISWHEGGPLL